ncbi:MAG: translation elongation factor 4 [Bacilli bacterium]|nr:translation elongation factor 4 [Bacilli bacterium]MDD3304858.1 translation elongation factor 4 [Bacilli bacterium]MDD4053703.1 translation elongation factor 4 [Bacilli bacterium]MDD4411574.1 translation elongation factor 4 [Bacilli bacterium]
MNINNVRNFCIIAHIDHGKSTLADRILEFTGSTETRDMKSQLLDSMDLERERGITIKLNAVQLNYKSDETEYLLHLIDTPGHVDFTYEVSRSLAACEGAILVVDAAQGIEAQTLANLYLALENDLAIIPVINKIDLPNADVEKVKKEINSLLGFKDDEIILTSAKTGVGIKDLLEAIIKRIPAPNGDKNEPLQALIFDSVFDLYRGVIASIRIMNGTVKVGDNIKMLSTGATYEVVELGINNPKEHKKNILEAGEVGFLGASIKNIEDVRVGDTITLDNIPCKIALPGYKPMKPMVFCGIYPIDSSQYIGLREALEKLKLNDASLTFEPETSVSLGFGFRCGFLGLLHIEIIEERIEREFRIDLIATSPSVVYEVTLTDGSIIMIQSPTKLPDRQKIALIREPFIKSNIFVPSTYVGAVMELCQDKRGKYISMEYLDGERVNIHYEIPLSEIVYDFFDKLKSGTKGYASFDYEIIGYKPSDLVKLDILINGELVDALSTIVHKDFAYKRGKAVVENLKELIPRQMFEVPIQAFIGTKAIARTDIKAMRKNVLAKCYGGDVSRKRKLLEKQKEGKKRMKRIGSVEIPQEAFLSVLSMDEK